MKRRGWEISWLVFSSDLYCVLHLSRGQIVDRDSAVLNLANEVAVEVAQANHQTICKFERDNGQKYIPVWHALRLLCRRALVNQMREGGRGMTF
jgi:hypothetical protein